MRALTRTAAETDASNILVWPGSMATCVVLSTMIQLRHPCMIRFCKIGLLAPILSMSCAPALHPPAAPDVASNAKENGVPKLSARVLTGDWVRLLQIGDQSMSGEMSNERHLDDGEVAWSSLRAASKVVHDPKVVKWMNENGVGFRCSGSDLRNLDPNSAARTIERVCLEGIDWEPVSSLSALRHLESCDGEVTDASLSHISGLGALRTLELFGAGEVTDNGLLHLARLTSLQKLFLSSPRITDEGLRSISGLTSLQELRLPKTEGGLRHIANLKALRVLDLSSTRVTDQGLEHIAGLSSLRTLELRMTNVTDQGLVHLAKLSALQQLDLHDAHTANLPGIGSLSALTHLTLYGNEISDEGLRSVSSLPRLQWLALDSSKITDSGLGALARLTSLKFLILAKTRISGTGLRSLSTLRSLTYLSLDHCTHITDEGLASLGESSGFPALGALALNDTHITDKALVHVANLRSLESLALINTRVTGPGLSNLSGMSNLKALLLNGTSVPDTAVVNLRSKLPRLEIFIK